MTAFADFEPVGEVVADGRSRIAFGRASVHADDRFLVSRRADGVILLTPVTSIPTRELAIWENPELLAGLLKGLQEASEGKVEEWPEMDELLESVDLTEDDEASA